MKALLLASVLALCAPHVASARSIAIPEESPVASVTVPDEWEVDDIEAGIEATSPDDSVYVSVEARDTDDLPSAIAEALVFFDEKGIEIDKESRVDRRFDVAGMKAVEASFKGRDEDGPTNVAVILVAVTESKALMMIRWASDEGLASNAEALRRLVADVRANGI